MCGRVVSEGVGLRVVCEGVQDVRACVNVHIKIPPFPDPAQLSVTCSMNKERIWYLLSREWCQLILQGHSGAQNKKKSEATSSLSTHI